MSYEEEDTCHMRRRIHVMRLRHTAAKFKTKVDSKQSGAW
jgi:hypothetical protein